MFSDLPMSHKEWKEKFLFVDSSLLPDSALTWHPQDDDTYHVDMPSLSLAERVNAHLLFY